MRDVVEMRVHAYVAAADTGPLRLDNDIVRRLELRYGAVFVGEFSWALQDEGWILRSI